MMLSCACLKAIRPLWVSEDSRYLFLQKTHMLLQYPLLYANPIEDYHKKLLHIFFKIESGNIFENDKKFDVVYL